MLVAICDAWAASMSELSERNGPRLASLSEKLPPDKSLMAYQWVSEFIYLCALFEENLNNSGVIGMAEPWLERVQGEEESVPSDIRRAVSDLQKAWVHLFIEVEPAAHDWIISQFERPEVIEFSEQLEKDPSSQPVTEQGNLYQLDKYRQRREDKGLGVWGNGAGGAG